MIRFFTKRPTNVSNDNLSFAQAFCLTFGIFAKDWGFFMGRLTDKLLFDKRDHMLLRMVNQELSPDSAKKPTQKTASSYLHPHGIKEMAESMGLRIAYAVIHLLGSMEAGSVDERLGALQRLRDEVINTAVGSMPRNTARVLLEVMKELVRAHGDQYRQLQLAHDFRAVASGKPRLVRAQLRHYHLLEMPEEWNQIAFDDHVHDVNTKGRKSSSHLIMDAWIKGIRRLRVIYYNFLEPRFAVELFEAARIMGIDLRIGIEFSARFRARYIQLIWRPLGFADSDSFLCFLAEPQVAAFMAETKKVSKYQAQYVFNILNIFNERHRRQLNKTYGLDLEKLAKSDFRTFVGTGQASLLHLAEFISAHIYHGLKRKIPILRKQYQQARENERKEIEQQIEALNQLDSEKIFALYLHPKNNPDIPHHNRPQDGPDVPDTLKLSPCELVDRLAQLQPAYHITLNLSNLSAVDVAELLYDCEGRIDRLELFNLKDYADGKTEQIAAINELQLAINRGNIIELKRLLADLLEKLKTATDDIDDVDNERVRAVTNILHDIATLKDSYVMRPLKARIGSDSTGRSARLHGMGLVLKETLPQRAQREIERGVDPDRQVIPVNMAAFGRTTLIPRDGATPRSQMLYRILNRISVIKLLTVTRHKDWVVKEDSLHLGFPGNIATLGGIKQNLFPQISLTSSSREPQPPKISLKYLNRNLKNTLKALIGFVPAFATFALTKDWWLLAYFGAFIWFGITGVRNIIQSMLGGGGIRRSPLLRINDVLQWERIADSLLFTGFSVPLLDYLVKTVLLDRLFGVTTTTNPVLLYAIMGLVNGIYLSSHNAFRGLPKGAVFGNLFRSILSIPVAIGINVAIGGLLSLAGFAGVENILQKWAAVISKAASDFVAGIIEGAADRYQNIQVRLRDYKLKLAQLFEAYTELEVRFPESEVTELLKTPEKFGDIRNEEVRDLQKIITVNGLDLLYFWMYQPRAREALTAQLKKLSPLERDIFLASQTVLRKQREITLLFADGLVGEKFSKALSFYLDHSKNYLAAIRKLVKELP